MNAKVTKQIEEMKKQTIGVEVEMNNITRSGAAKIAATFFGTNNYKNTASRNGYCTWSAWDTQGREWKFQKDVSIEGPDDEKCELVTPILTYADMELLQELIRKLRKAGAKSDASRGCGVHIHIGAKGHTPQTLRNLVNIMATALATVLFTRIYHDLGATISTAVMTVVVLIFGEVTPKSIAKETPEKFAMSVCGIIGFLVVLLTPINLLFTLWKMLISHLFHVENDEGMTQEELITIVEEAMNDGDLEEHESDLITAAIEFNDLEVNEILTPRVDVVALDIETSMEGMEEAFRTNSFSRFPI